MFKKSINLKQLRNKTLLILIVIVFAIILSFCTKKTTSPDEQLKAPSNLEIEHVYNHWVKLTWQDNSNKEANFLIDIKKGENDWLVNYGEIDPNDIVINAVILEISKPDTVWSFRMRVTDGNDYSEYSETVAWFYVSSAPTNLVLEQIAQDSIKLTWQDNSIGELNFRVDRKIGDENWQESYKILEPNTTNYIDYNPSLYDTCYCYLKVYAISGNSHSNYCQNYFIPLLPSPSNLQIEVLSATSVKLTWQDNCEGEDGYVVYKTEGGSTWDSTNVPANTEEWIDENVIPGIVNYYKLCAFQENYHSGYLENNINTLPAPSNLQIEQLNVTTFKLTWQDNSIFEHGFKIDKKVATDDWQIEYGIVSESCINWIDENTEINDTIQYRVYAFSGVNNSISDSITIENTIPEPENLTYTFDWNDIILTWQYTLSGIDGFTIARKEGENNWNNTYTEVDASILEWSENIDPEQIYYYKVRARYSTYYSNYSNEIALFIWCNVPSGSYTFGEGDTIKTINYDYQIMKYEVTNQQYVDYLEEALNTGYILIDGDYVMGYYEGDQYWSAGDYIYYYLGTPYSSCNYARVSYDGSAFIINVPSGYNPGDFDNHPVVCVTWFGSLAFAEYYGLRLPTEHEWEKAARGNTGWDYPWGNSIDGSRANYEDSGDPWDNGTTPVGFYNGQNYQGFQTTDSPSTYGVYDMAGNVCEWTDSFYGGSNTYYRVKRGGHWCVNNYNQLIWYRYYGCPKGMNYNIGFRCARNY